jgi:hypothetical protein
MNLRRGAADRSEYRLVISSSVAKMETPISLSFASQARKPRAVLRRCPMQPLVLNAGINVLGEMSFGFCI